MGCGLKTRRWRTNSFTSVTSRRRLFSDVEHDWQTSMKHGWLSKIKQASQQQRTKNKPEHHVGAIDKQRRPLHMDITKTLHTGGVQASLICGHTRARETCRWNSFWRKSLKPQMQLPRSKNQRSKGFLRYATLSNGMERGGLKSSNESIHTWMQCKCSSK